jgi:uncharacterized protein (DUF1015 family)
VVPFRAWRYSAQAGELASLVAPPYDVIGPDLQSRLYARSLHNAVRVDLGVTTPSDGDCDNQYTRAAALLAQWKESGVLVRDPQPSITFVEESFAGPDGRPGRRHGFLAAMRIFEFGEGVVFPHEQTLTGPKEDRFRLMTATAMSLSPVFLLYDLPGDGITAAWRAGLGEQAPAGTIADEAGTVTNVWPTSDPELINTVAQSLAQSRFLIADGHHRYETAQRYQQARLAKTGDDPASRRAFAHCLAYFANMGDPALTIYPTHRLVAGLPASRLADLLRALAGAFAVERLDILTGGLGTAGKSGGAAAQTAIASYLRSHPRGAFGLWGPAFATPYGLSLTDSAAAHAAASGHSAAYQDLDVTILQTLILEKALGISAADMTSERYVSFFKDSAEAFARLEAGEFQAGFFMNPTGLDQVRQVAFGGERMPQKTTFFYPKLPTGIVFHDLTGRL